VFAAAALLVALGLYVYLGALAEQALLGNNGRSRRWRNVRSRRDH